MSLVFDEYGRPFIIIKDQGTKSRLKGIAALKVNYPALPVRPCFRASLGAITSSNFAGQDSNHKTAPRQRQERLWPAEASGPNHLCNVTLVIGPACPMPLLPRGDCA